MKMVQLGRTGPRVSAAARAEALRRIADAKGASVAQIAIAWLRHRAPTR